MISLIHRSILCFSLTGLAAPSADAQFTPAPTRPVREPIRRGPAEMPTIQGLMQPDHPTSLALQEVNQVFHDTVSRKPEERFAATSELLHKLAEKIENRKIRDPQELGAIAHCIEYQVYIRPGNALEDLSSGGDKLIKAALRVNKALVIAARKSEGIADPYDQTDFFNLKSDLGRWHSLYVFNKSVADSCSKTFAEIYVNPKDLHSLLKCLESISGADLIATRAIVFNAPAIVKQVKLELAIRKQLAWTHERNSQTETVVKLLRTFHNLTEDITFPNGCTDYTKILSDARAEMTAIINEILCCDVRSILSRRSTIEERKLCGEILALGIRLQPAERQRFCDVVGELGFAEGAARERLDRVRNGYGKDTSATAEVLLDSFLIVFLGDLETTKKYLQAEATDPNTAIRFHSDVIELYLLVRNYLPKSRFADIRSVIEFHFERGLESGAYLRAFCSHPQLCGQHAAHYIAGFSDTEVVPASNKVLQRGAKKLREAFGQEGEPFKALRANSKEDARVLFLEGYKAAAVGNCVGSNSEALEKMGVKSRAIK